MTIKDLHDHLAKLLADGVNPETPVVRCDQDVCDFVAPDNAPWIGRAVVCDHTSWGEPREVWYFEGELDDHIKGDERQVLYL